MNTTKLIALAGLALACASDVLAAHAVRKVPPIVLGGVEFVVPNDNGLRGYVRAINPTTGAVLWEKTIYRVWFSFPLPEGDVWWVLIKQTKAKDGKLLILSEKDKWYSLDPQTRKVKRISAKDAEGHSGENHGQQAVAPYR